MRQWLLDLERHLKCEPSLYNGRIGRAPTVARALQPTLTVQLGHAIAEKAAKKDSEEADPLVGLYISAVALEDYGMHGASSG